jgi:hypothetical protein
MVAVNYRIGNYIQYNNENKSVGRITALISDFVAGLDYCQIDHVINKKHWLINVNPIPITEEWLKKFDFKKQNSIKHCLLYSIKTKKQQYFSVSEMLDGYEDPNELTLKEIKKYWSFDGNKYDVKIKYVHQLQNLYFALTCEELQLKN